MKCSPVRSLLVRSFIVIIFGHASAQLPQLKTMYQDHFYIGTALNRGQIFNQDTMAAKVIISQFNSITPENILKWYAVHPEPDRYDFEASDQLVAFGKENNMFVVGHTLVWHAQTPRWVFQDTSGTGAADRETLLQRMKEHIFTVVGRYKGQIQSWDVVNEALDDNGQLRKGPWMDVIGADYIQKAFVYAREADPEAELYYNDYNMYKSGKVEGVVQLVRSLQEKGVRIDGIGFQGHWGFDYPLLEELEASIVAYAEVGVKVMITELDISALPNPWSYRGADIAKRFELQQKLNPYPEGLPDSVQTQLAERYAALFALFVKHRDKISRVTFWGVHDGQSWKNNFPVRGRTDYPLLFDRKCQPKPAFFTVIKAARN
jgi:endo-1,4-beta-xylanase